MKKQGIFAKTGCYPRMYFCATDVKKFRERLEQDAALREEFAGFVKKADDLLDVTFMDEAYANSVYSQHGRYYELGAQMEALSSHLGFAYQVTGKAAYAEKLKQAMLFYTAFDKWTGPLNKDRDTVWNSDLSTTRLSVATALSFDCIYDTLSPDERKTIAQGVLRLGIRPLLDDWVLPETRVHALDSMGHNWWAVCIGLAGVALLEFYEYAPQADAWLNEILCSLHGFCNYAGEVLLNKTANFDDKGLFYESAGYFNYGVGELMHFAYTYLRTMQGGDADVQFAHIKEVSSAFLSMSYPTSRKEAPLLFPDFGDSGLDGGFTGLPQYMLLCGYQTEEMLYCYRTYRKEKSLFDYLFPEILDAEKPEKLHLPENQVFDQSGYAYLRSSWEKDATLLAIRCGYTWNHAHDDAGSYMILDKGYPFICDSGNCSYDLPEYHGYYCTAAAHNVVAVNGRALRAESIFRGGKYPGTLSHFRSGAHWKYLLADVTGPTCDQCARNYRSFLVLDNDTVVIFDDLLAHEEAEFASYLHFYGEGSLQGDTALLSNGHSTAKATFVFPENVRIEERDGLLPPKKHIGTNTGAKQELPHQPYFAAVAPQKTRVQQFMTVLQLNGAAQATVTPFTEKNTLGVRISRGEVCYEIAYNLLADGRKMHENSNSHLLGLETDAYLLACRRVSGQPEKYLMIYGSYLRKADGEKVLYSSFTKDFTEVEA